MSGITIGLSGFVFMLVMLALRVHIGMAMFTAGAVIYLVINHGDTNALLFKNIGTGKHNMVYRRGDGSIGWVEPA